MVFDFDYGMVMLIILFFGGIFCYVVVCDDVGFLVG